MVPICFLLGLSKVFSATHLPSTRFIFFIISTQKQTNFPNPNTVNPSGASEPQRAQRAKRSLYDPSGDSHRLYNPQSHSHTLHQKHSHILYYLKYSTHSKHHALLNTPRRPRPRLHGVRAPHQHHQQGPDRHPNAINDRDGISRRARPLRCSTEAPQARLP